jgi:hypothetical protein
MTAGAVGAYEALPFVIVGAEIGGAFVVGTGRTIVQGGRALAADVSTLGVKGAYYANAATANTVAIEGTLATAAIASGADTPLSAPASTARKVTAGVVETVADTAQDVRQLAAKQTITTASRNGENAGQGVLKNVEVKSHAGGEVVYTHKTAEGDVNYIGISNDAKRRAGEHRLDPAKTGETMEVQTDPLTHGAARTIEAKLLRERLAQARAEGIIDGTESIEEQLRKAGLKNKNRGRNPDRWEDIDPDDYIKDTGEKYDIKTPVISEEDKLLEAQ